MRRRGPGIAGAKNRAKAKERLAARGRELNSENQEHVEEQVARFKASLEEFARKHKHQINGDPEFRRHFHTMCSKIGVDPLVSSKGFWAELLGFGDFYYELGVQVVDVCIATRPENGGLIDLGDLCRLVQGMRGEGTAPVTPDDVRKAIGGLSGLGSGFAVVRIGTRDVVVSVPLELSRDHTEALAVAEETGFVTRSSLAERLGWSPDRIQRTLNVLLRQGMVWVDDPERGERAYWVPSLHAPSSS